MSAATKLNRKTKAAQLDEYDLTDSSSRSILIGSVKQMFERGAVRTQAAAGNLIKLIQENKMDQVDAKMGKLEKAVNTPSDKRKQVNWNRKPTTRHTNEKQQNTLLRLKAGAANYQHSS